MNDLLDLLHDIRQAFRYGLNEFQRCRYLRNVDPNPDRTPF